jgi:hypothetical protein
MTVRYVNMQEPLLSNGLTKNMFPQQRLRYNNEERCFLRGPYRDLISGASGWMDG